MKPEIQTCGKLSMLSFLMIFILFSCTTPKKKAYDVVNIKGNGEVINYSKSFFGYVLNSDSLHSIAAMVSDGDLLLLGKEQNIYFVQETQKKKELTFVNKPPFGYVNGKINAINIEKDTDLEPWFKKMRPDDISDLKTIFISSPIPESYFNYFREIAKTNPDVNLFFDEEFANKELLKIFKPKFLSGVILSDNDLALYPGLQGLQMLIVADHDSTVSSPLIHLPNLKQVILPELKHWNISKEYFVNNKQVEKLTILGDRDMTFAQHLKDLRELCLVHFKNEDASRNLDFLKNFGKLEVLCLNGDGFTSLDAINNLSGLRWLSLMTKTNQKDLESIINHHKDLEVFEIKSDSALNLNPVSQLQNLKGLVITNETKVDTFLYTMKNLKYLSLPDPVLKNDSVAVVSLQKRLPACTIVPNEGFCLGSGWLFLLIPFTLLFGLYFHKKSKVIRENE